MYFCIFFRLTWEFRLLPYPILIKYLRDRHHQTSRDWLCWGQLLWRLNRYILTKVSHCCLQDLELDFGLQDLELDLRDLALHPWICSWAWRLPGLGGIGALGASIFSLTYCLTKLCFKVFLTLISCYFHIYIYIIYIYIYIYIYILLLFW